MFLVSGVIVPVVVLVQQYSLSLPCLVNMFDEVEYPWDLLMVESHCSCIRAGCKMVGYYQLFFTILDFFCDFLH